MQTSLQLPEGFTESVVGEIQRNLRGSRNAYIPSAAELEAVLQASFWASLALDEGRQPVFTISIRPRNTASRVFGLHLPLELHASTLAKIATATQADLSGVHVGPGESGLEIFGIDTLLGTAAPVRIEVRAAGTLVIKSGSASVAVIADRRAELIDPLFYRQYWFVDAEWSSEFDETKSNEHRLDAVVRAMFTNGQGGIILIVPRATIPELPVGLEIQYRLEPFFAGLVTADQGQTAGAAAVASATEVSALHDSNTTLRWEVLRRERFVQAIAQTTAVDGATVMSDLGELVGFGAKIRAAAPDLHVRKLHPVRGYEAKEVAVGKLGGTRHQSAARFVARFPGSFAAVASHDKKLSLMRANPDGVVDCLEHADWLF
jgi:hypothetical protein